MSNRLANPDFRGIMAVPLLEFTNILPTTKSQCYDTKYFSVNNFNTSSFQDYKSLLFFGDYCFICTYDYKYDLYSFNSSSSKIPLIFLPNPLSFIIIELFLRFSSLEDFLKISTSILHILSLCLARTLSGRLLIRKRIWLQISFSR